MNFITIIMTLSIIFWQKLRESVHKNYCPVSIQMHLTFVYVILRNRAGIMDVSNASMGTYINQTIVYFTSFVVEFVTSWC